MKKIQIEKFYEIATNSCKVFDDIAGSYYHFDKKYKNKLEDNHNIDSGYDYACYLFSILEKELKNI